jgi:hypothetical protein
MRELDLIFRARDAFSFAPQKVEKYRFFPFIASNVICGFTKCSFANWINEVHL